MHVSGPTGLEIFGSSLGHEKRSFDVGIKVVVVLLLVDVSELSKLLVRGIVHKDIEASKRLDAVLDELVALGYRRDVCPEGDGLALPLGCDRVNDLLGLALVGHVVDHHGRAVRGETFRDRSTDATRGTRDEGDFSGKREYRGHC